MLSNSESASYYCLSGIRIHSVDRKSLVECVRALPCRKCWHINITTPVDSIEIVQRCDDPVVPPEVYLRNLLLQEADSDRCLFCGVSGVGAKVCISKILRYCVVVVVTTIGKRSTRDSRCSEGEITIENWIKSSRV